MKDCCYSRRKAALLQLFLKLTSFHAGVSIYVWGGKTWHWGDGTCRPPWPLQWATVASLSELGARTPHFSLIYHSLQQWNLPSMFRRILQLHNSLSWRFDSSVHTNMCVSLSFWWICVGQLSAAYGCRHFWFSVHTHKGLSVLLWKCITVSFPWTWRDRCERLVAASGMGG